ncbi:MAG TPA: (4Fe-4S)-binding protein, partial [Thermoanaerobaculia bacterium]
MSGKLHVYEGEAITVTYDAKRCIHFAECVHGLPEVFDTAKRPWIAADGAPADRVAEVVQRCPSGALHFTRKDGGAAEEAPAENVVTLSPDGPLRVHGTIEIEAADGTLLATETRATLCRCGAA